MGEVYQKSKHRIKLSNPLIRRLLLRPVVITLRTIWWVFFLFLAKDAIPATSVGLVTYFCNNVVASNVIL